MAKQIKIGRKSRLDKVSFLRDLIKMLDVKEKIKVGMVITNLSQLAIKYNISKEWTSIMSRRVLKESKKERYINILETYLDERKRK